MLKPTNDMTNEVRDAIFNVYKTLRVNSHQQYIGVKTGNKQHVRTK